MPRERDRDRDRQRETGGEMEFLLKERRRAWPRMEEGAKEVRRRRERGEAEEEVEEEAGWGRERSREEAVVAIAMTGGQIGGMRRGVEWSGERERLRAPKSSR
jgi:hypothetical protein